jgi:hypothetical protein
MRTVLSLAVLFCLVASAQGAEDQVPLDQPGKDEARLLRFPAIHGDRLVFTYAGDLYSVSAGGGIAFRPPRICSVPTPSPPGHSAAIPAADRRRSLGAMRPTSVFP